MIHPVRMQILHSFIIHWRQKETEAITKIGETIFGYSVSFLGFCVTSIYF